MQSPVAMWTVLAAALDLTHALSMAAWLLGLPLLFARSHPRLRRAYAIYALAFIVLSQLSMLFLGECFLTTLVRPLWERGGSPASHEWFTVRLSQAIFGMAPSHRAISRLSEALIALTAVAVLASLRHGRVAPAGPERAAGAGEVTR